MRLLLRWHQRLQHPEAGGLPKKTDAPVEVKATKKAGRPKKRGPKSVWGNFILRRLRQCDRPLSYSELVRDAMVLNNLPAEKEKNAKASVLNAAFRLRSTLGKIDTVGLPGKKEKFLILKSWMNADGGLKAPYDKLFADVANKPMDDVVVTPPSTAMSSTESSKGTDEVGGCRRGQEDPGPQACCQEDGCSPLPKRLRPQAAAKKTAASPMPKAPAKKA